MAAIVKSRRAEGAQVAAALDDDESRRAEGAQVAAALDDELIWLDAETCSLKRQLVWQDNFLDS